MCVCARVYKLEEIACRTFGKENLYRYLNSQVNLVLLALKLFFIRYVCITTDIFLTNAEIVKHTAEEKSLKGLMKIRRSCT